MIVENDMLEGSLFRNTLVRVVHILMMFFIAGLERNHIPEVDFMV